MSSSKRRRSWRLREGFPGSECLGHMPVDTSPFWLACVDNFWGRGGRDEAEGLASPFLQGFRGDSSGPRDQLPSAESFDEAR